MGVGKSAVCWYRVALPAMFLGADWVGIHGRPPNIAYDTGTVRGATQFPDMDDYRIVVVQQARGVEWMGGIRNLQKRGIKVLYEIDDYVHAIRKMPDHAFGSGFRKKDVDEMEACMRVADGIICSTEFIAQRYAKFNRTWVCENGVDIGRYDLTLPERPTTNVLWSGATGHTKAIKGWLPALREVMRRHDDVCFVTVGVEYADSFRAEFGNRAVSVPFTMIDTYPAAMTLGDITIAPAGRNNFFRAKSDLRFVEAAALSQAVIADPFVYGSIEHGVTGFHAATAKDFEEQLEHLLADPSLRLQAGAKARDYVRECRHAGVTCKQWAIVFAEVMG